MKVQVTQLLFGAWTDTVIGAGALERAGSGAFLMTPGPRQWARG